jgi:r-opsin
LFSSLEKAASLILFCWAYAIGWSIPPFVGWGKYIPEGYLKYDNQIFKIIYLK